MGLHTPQDVDHILSHLDCLVPARHVNESFDPMTALILSKMVVTYAVAGSVSILGFMQFRLKYSSFNQV